MSGNITIARPYAKAIFHIADNNDMLVEWDRLLSFLLLIIDQNFVKDFLKNKTIGYNDKSKIIINILDSYGSFNKDIRSFYLRFVRVLSYYGRLLCIKDIYGLYKKFMNIKLSRLDIEIKVAFLLSSDQKDNIVVYLSKYFNKKISALFIIDEKILGGIFLKIEDSVFDASIMGNLISLESKILV